jgi:hypothetical protein
MAQVIPAEEVKVAAVAAEAKPAAEVTATIASSVDATLQGMQPMDAHSSGPFDAFCACILASHPQCQQSLLHADIQSIWQNDTSTSPVRGFGPHLVTSRVQVV